MPSAPYPSRWVIPSSTPDLGDDADVFPFLPGREFAALKTPLWSGKTDVSVSGRSRVRSLWSYPVWRFRFAHGYLRDGSANQELQRLFNFFNAHAGTGACWLYRDRDDNAVSANNFGTGDGATKTFQITRTVTFGGVTFTEPVRAFYGTPTIFDNGSAVSGANYTIGALGQITFTTAPLAGHALTWSGNFLFLCQFDQDELDPKQEMQGVWSAGGLDFRTIKP